MSNEITLEDILAMKSENNNNKKTERKSCDLFLNIGTTKKLKDSEGNEKEIRVTLPYNIDLVNMPSRKVPSKEGDYKKIIVSSNMLLELLREVGKSMKAGESKELQLKCWLTKVDTSTTMSETDNLISKEDILA